ncbi:MAG: PhoH family protein, partial [Candidatus Methylomirabilis sp.]|nr:PhoH family protein [Deltaproteobacteria bacterium]
MPERFEELVFEDNALAQTLFGANDANLKAAEKALEIRIVPRGNTLLFEGDPARVDLARRLLADLYYCMRRGHPFHPSDVVYAAQMLRNNPEANLRALLLDAVAIPAKRRIVTPKTLTQKRYIDAIARCDVVFGIGPAGTGKTYLAMAMAVASLLKKETDRIILCRPAVEAGEHLGFLPGDMAAKVNPYLRPLYDALHDIMDREQAEKLMERGTIEVAPLAFMRGRTLSDSFLILDEAQNTTREQMRMFLTRMGVGSKAVVTGDVTQIDLRERPSGLVQAQKILQGVVGVEFVYFSEKDVMRHPLVQKIVSAYEGEDAAAAT